MAAVLEIKRSLLINSISFLRRASHIGDVRRSLHVLITFVHINQATLCEMIRLYLGTFSLCMTQSIIFWAEEYSILALVALNIEFIEMFCMCNLLLQKYY